MNTLDKLKSKEAVIGIVGLGYVGLPLAYAFSQQNIKVLGFDIDASQIATLASNKSYIKHISDETIAIMRQEKSFDATLDFSLISEVDVIIICVPTPLTKHRDPDLGPIIATAHSIAPFLQKGQLVVLESSTYPGTTDEILANELEISGLKKNVDFYLAYSPEREDPGNPDFSTSTLPKIVGADTQEARSMVKALYQDVVTDVVAVSSSRTAEAIKLTENIFRSVNIALVNELKVIFDAMDIDVWEVIDGAATKPFGFMPHYPGPGLGGHCIPIDPFYLTYKAREYGISTKFIELAGEINTHMPTYVVTKLTHALGEFSEKSVNGAKILIIGIAYKKDLDDMRESPSLVLIKLLEALGAKVDYHDNFIPTIPHNRDHQELIGKESLPLTQENVSNYDAILISTDHSYIDYQLLADSAKIVVDTRNAMESYTGQAKIIKA